MRQIAVPFSLSIVPDSVPRTSGVAAVTAFIAGQYLTGQPAGWADGDWNGDQLFDAQDFVAAFIDGGYLAAPRSAVRINLSRVDIADGDLVHSAFVEWSTPSFAIPLFDRPFANHSKSPTDPREYFSDAISQEVIAHFRFHDAADSIVAPSRSIDTKPKSSTNHSGRITSDRICFAGVDGGGRLKVGANPSRISLSQKRSGESLIVDSLSSILSGDCWNPTQQR